MNSFGVKYAKFGVFANPGMLPLTILFVELTIILMYFIHMLLFFTYLCCEDQFDVHCFS